jgi:hypothetical protein
LPPNPKIAKEWDAEWEVTWAEFKKNREKIKEAKEKWMEGETDNWEEQYSRAMKIINMTLHNKRFWVNYGDQLRKLDEMKITRLEEEKKQAEEDRINKSR